MVSLLFKCLGAATVFAMSPLSATILYSTGGGAPPAYDPHPVNAWDIKLSGIPAVAAEFNPSVTGILGQIELPIDNVAGTGSVVVELLSNNGGVPGSVIESWTPSLGSIAAMVTVSSVLHPTLTNGTNYWVAVTTTGTREANWFCNASFPLLRGTDFFIGSWIFNSQATMPSVAVLSLAAAPEPSTGGLAMAGLLAAIAAGALRKIGANRKIRLGAPSTL